MVCRRHLIKNIIYIYKDDGVSVESLLQTTKTFQKHSVPENIVKTINADEVKNGEWMDNAVIFIMPGGADLHYVEKLNGTGNAKIKQYVEGGGSYLGICAGAYYGSTYVEFDKNGALEILGDRELKFFKGKSIGPDLAPYDYNTKSGSRAARLSTTFNHLPEAIVYYNGGGYFENADSFTDTKIIGYYENKLPAIIHVKYGEGNVILSGVHFEYNPYLLNSHDSYLKHIIPVLKTHEGARGELISTLLKILGVIARSSCDEANQEKP